MPASEQPKPAFVNAAILAGHLYRMRQTARRMSLSASNAKGVAARAGDKALGFRPITDFIAEMASKTILHATRINELALTISRLSVTSLRVLDGMQRFEQAAEALDDPAAQAFLRAKIEHSRQARETMGAEVDEIMQQLAAQLEEIHQALRASSMIVSNSRTEASRADDFRKYLDSIADSVETAASDIQREMIHCRHLIETLNDDTQRPSGEHAPALRRMG